MVCFQVTAVLKRVKPEYSGFHRYKRQQRQQQNQNDSEQTFHVVSIDCGSNVVKRDTELILRYHRQ